jgi:hypothetical protein
MDASDLKKNKYGSNNAHSIGWRLFWRGKPMMSIERRSYHLCILQQI